MNKPINTLLAIAALAFAGQAVAQGHLEIRTIVQKEETVVTEDGNEEVRVVDAETVVPGDEVIYTVTYSNVSDQQAENVVITNPLPAELTYVDGSAEGTGTKVEFSADGGQSYGTPTELLVKDGAVERRAEPRDFTHIRWVIADSLAPGEEGIAGFRARLN